MSRRPVPLRPTPRALPAGFRLFCLLACLELTAYSATQRAFVFVGLSASETQAARLAETAASLRESFLRRGFAPDEITILAHQPTRPLRRETLLGALAPHPKASPEDETWLILLGTSAPDRSGQPSFQIPGPRLTASDFADAVTRLPGRKFVLVGTSGSGAFLAPLLELPGVEAVAATADSGQVNEPRFPLFWADALAADPRADFPALAARAARRVADFYTDNSLAQGETARRIDRTSGRIIEAPFPLGEGDVVTPSAVASAPAPGSARPTGIDISRIEIPRPSADASEAERRAADEESRALLAAARAAAQGSPHPALILRTELDLLVASDFSVRESWRSRAYLRDGEALDAFGSLLLPSDPPFIQSSLLSARIILPDASQVLLLPAGRSADLPNPEKIGPGSSLLPSRNGTFELPDLVPDSVVELEWRTERRGDGSLPEFFHEWPLARPFPQRAVSLRVTLPSAERWRLFAPNLPAPLPPAPGSAETATTWELTDIPAHQPLPHDPPPRASFPWFGVSSVATWTDFAAWYRRLAADSDRAGPGVESLAAELAAAHPDRAGRLRAAYERVAALRYVAIELGVGAFRPRSPEQVWRQRYGDCKDKAGLLVALLTRLGIPAEFALVNRFDTTFTDFPGWQFNHALARVPADPAAGQPHDLWLDSTDRLVPFATVAPGNLGRRALVFAPGYASAAFHQIGAAQEPPATWTETFSTTDEGLHRLQVTATGSAELALRRLLLGLSPAQRRLYLSEWLGGPVLSLAVPDAFDLSRPYTLTLLTPVAPRPALRPLVPGLASYLERSPRPRLWDEGRGWAFTRVTASGVESLPIPAQLP
jgi:transglutaminase-like putative cysteine protease